MKTRYVWDLPTRLFHWALVFFFCFSYLTGEEETDWHSYSGYIIVLLIVFRIVWGFKGNQYARFSNFIYSPKTTHEYTLSLMKGDPQHYFGHNPLASLMIFTLLFSLFATTFSGLQAYSLEGKGPFANATIEVISPAQADDDEDEYEQDHRAKYGYLNNEEEEEAFWEEVHEFFANFTLMLVFVHIIGVIISSTVHKESLVKSMINGYKEYPNENEDKYH